MKKILSACICLLLLWVLATPVLADQTATMTVKPSKTELNPGDKVTFTVSVSKVDNCSVGGFKFEFDESVFVYDSGRHLAILDDFNAGVSTAAGNVAGYFMNGSGTIEGDMFSVTLQVRENAKSGTYTVSGKPSLTAGGDKLTCSVVDAQIVISNGAASTATPETTVPAQPTDTPNADAQINESGPAVENTVTSDSEDIPTGIEKAENPTPQSQMEVPSGKSVFPWEVLLIGVIAVAVAVAGGVFLFFEIRKVKKTDQ